MCERCDTTRPEVYIGNRVSIIMNSGLVVHGVLRRVEPDKLGLENRVKTITWVPRVSIKKFTAGGVGY